MVWLGKVITEFDHDLQRWMSASGLWYIAAGKCGRPKAVGLLFSGTFKTEIRLLFSSLASVLFGLDRLTTWDPGSF